jgi:hypothetical protein
LVDKINLLIWGPYGKLLLGEEALQNELLGMIKKGVKVTACKACADRLGISEGLTELAVKVFYTGEALTNATKSPEWAVLTF